MTLFSKRNAIRMLSSAGFGAENQGAGRSPRISWSSGFLGLLLFISVCGQGQAESVVLSWNASDDPTAVKFNVYYGGVSGDYTNMTSFSGTDVTITGLVPGATYFFAVTAVDAFGDESILSQPISYTMPADPPGLQISTASGGLFQLTFPGQTGHVYEIQATMNFVTWNIIGTQTATSNGALTFTDSNAANYPRRFYRTYDTQP